MARITRPPAASQRIAKNRKGATPPDRTVQQCGKDDQPRIVSIAWLDGTDTKEIATATQYVNLPRDEKWVDKPEIKNKDRLGIAPRIKVRFDRPGTHGFNVELIPDVKNTAYTASEKRRNGNFSHQEGSKAYVTDADGTKILDGDFALVAGGGYRFKAEAVDAYGNIVRTGWNTTKRLFYLVEVKMKGLKSIAKSLNPTIREYKKHHIIIKRLPAVEMEHLENVGRDFHTFQGLARKAYGSSGAVKAKEPYVLAIAYTDHLAVKNYGQVLRKERVEGGTKGGKVIVPVRGPGLDSSEIEDRNLWWGIEKNAEWLESAKFVTEDGSEIRIPKEKCRPVPGAGSTYAAKQVEVDISDLPAKTGTLVLRVNWIDHMRGGLSLTTGNLVSICSRVWWTDVSDEEQNCVAIHEIGHRIGMVASGEKKLPDKPASYYLGGGHVGDHCFKGAPAGAADYDTDAAAQAAQCVMFGAVNMKTAYCSDCSPVVKKLDLSQGWGQYY